MESCHAWVVIISKYFHKSTIIMNYEFWIIPDHWSYSEKSHLSCGISIQAFLAINSSSPLILGQGADHAGPAARRVVWVGCDTPEASNTTQLEDCRKFWCEMMYKIDVKTCKKTDVNFNIHVIPLSLSHLKQLRALYLSLPHSAFKCCMAKRHTSKTTGNATGDTCGLIRSVETVGTPKG